MRGKPLLAGAAIVSGLVLALGLLGPDRANLAQEVRYYYLSPLDGLGTDADPFRSRCVDLPGAGNIDLRPDPTMSTGYMLCASASLPANQTGVILLSTNKQGRVTGPTKVAAAQALGLSVGDLAGSTMETLLPQLLLDIPQRKAVWPTMRASRTGHYEIHLGRLEWRQTAWLYPAFEDGGRVADATTALRRWLEPARAWAATLTEHWNCGSSTLLTCVYTWHFQTVNGDWALVSSQASITSVNGSAEERAEADLATDDMEVTVTLIALASGGANDVQCGTTARFHSSARTFYSFVVQNTGGTKSTKLHRRIAGSNTEIGSDAGSWTVLDQITTRADGSAVTGLLNGTPRIGPVTDTNITTYTRGGIRYTGNQAGASCTLDNWSATDYSPPAGPTAHPPSRRLQ